MYDSYITMSKCSIIIINTKQKIELINMGCVHKTVTYWVLFSSSNITPYIFTSYLIVKKYDKENERHIE